MHTFKIIVKYVVVSMILGISQMLVMSCGSRQNADQSTETAYEDDSEEDEQGDADDWHYRVLLKTEKPQPGKEYLYDGAPVFAGLSLQNAAGASFAFDDEIDYGNFARRCCLPTNLRKEPSSRLPRNGINSLKMYLTKRSMSRIRPLAWIALRILSGVKKPRNYGMMLFVTCRSIMVTVATESRLSAIRCCIL